ncbi:MAG: DUF420 domain-containing protein [Magnetococcus sp. DMHC-6]
MNPIIGLLPHVQAFLNFTTIVCLTLAFLAIRHQNRQKHKKWMMAAVLVSTIFLVSYLIYHGAVGNVKFAGLGWIRPVYFTILASHVLLAALTLPMLLVTILRAPWKTMEPNTPYPRHRLWAKWTLPIWLYVSISGLLVYTLAFHIYT